MAGHADVKRAVAATGQDVNGGLLGHEIQVNGFGSTNSWVPAFAGTTGGGGDD
jgi:hypothetical protein